MNRILNSNCCYQRRSFKDRALVSALRADPAPEPVAICTGALGRCRALMAVVALILSIAPVAWAHKVNVFARVEGNRIIVEGYFGGMGKAIDCPVEILDQDGNKIHAGRTDDNGVYFFDASSLPPVSGDLKVVLEAGMGHKAVYDLAAADLPAVETKAGTSGAIAAGRKPNSTSRIGVPQTEPVKFQDASALNKALDESLDRKIQPILRMLGEQQKLLMEQKMKGPGLVEIIGGIGWIFGLVGVWAYFTSRQRTEKK